MNPLVTISVPVFKCEDFIENCLLSIKNQTYTNIEVVLVNDVSQDKSAEIAADFIEKYELQSWKIITLEKNSGLSVVRNQGILNSKGKYIFFVDSDDEIFSDAIESLVIQAEKYNAEITMGEVEGVMLPSYEKTDVFPIFTKENVLNGNQSILTELVKGGFAVSSWNKLISLDFLKSNHLFFTKGLYAQDSLHSFEMGLYLSKLVFLRKKTYRYFLHQGSVVHNRKKIHFDNWITIAEKINGYLIKEKSKTKRKLILEYLINFKSVTLEMNWKAQKNEHLWKESYKAYRKLKGLTLRNYLSKNYSLPLKIKDFYLCFPLFLGYRIFRWRYDR